MSTERYQVLGHVFVGAPGPYLSIKTVVPFFKFTLTESICNSLLTVNVYV
jgi:hypothetical protein